MDDASTAADPVSGDRPVQRLSSRRCARTFLLTRWADVFGNGGVDRDGEAAAGDHFVNGYPPVLDQWRFDADTRDACAARGIRPPLDRCPTGRRPAWLWQFGCELPCRGQAPTWFCCNTTWTVSTNEFGHVFSACRKAIIEILQRKQQTEVSRPDKLIGQRRLLDGAPCTQQTAQSGWNVVGSKDTLPLCTRMPMTAAALQSP